MDGASTIRDQGPRGVHVIRLELMGQEGRIRVIRATKSRPFFLFCTYHYPIEFL